VVSRLKGLENLLAHDVSSRIGSRDATLIAGDVEVALHSPGVAPGVLDHIVASRRVRVAHGQNGVESGVVARAVALINAGLVIEEGSANTEGNGDWSGLEAGLELRNAGASLVATNAVAHMGGSPVLSISAVVAASGVRPSVRETSLMDETLGAHHVVQSPGAPSTGASLASLVAADELLRGQPSVVVSLEATSVGQHAGSGKGPAASATSLVPDTMVAAGSSPVHARRQVSLDGHRGDVVILLRHNSAEEGLGLIHSPSSEDVLLIISDFPRNVVSQVVSVLLGDDHLLRENRGKGEQSD